MRLLLSLTLALVLSVSALAQNNKISVTSFNAIARGKQVLLSWDQSTGTSANYSLEKSRNGSDFTDFGNVQGAAVNVQYMETDFAPFDGLSYYRLRVTESDGSVSFSNIVPVKYTENMVPVSPVDVDDNARVSSDNSMLVIVLNSAGDEFYSKVKIASDGNPVECNNPDPALNTGTYTIVGCSDQQFYARQMLVK